MAKKQTEHTADLHFELRKRIKAITVELTTLQHDLGEAINHKAHLKQYYTGRIEQAESELAYLKGLLG